MTKKKPAFAFVGSNTTKERNGGEGKGIEVYRIDPQNGDWTHIQSFETENPGFLSIDSKGNHLYVAHANRTYISAYGIEDNGTIHLLSKKPSGGWNPSFLTVDVKDEYLYVSNTSTASISAFRIKEDGDVEPFSIFHQVCGLMGPLRLADQTNPKPHQVVNDPTGDFWIAPDKGCDCVHVYSREEGSNTLKEVSCMPVRASWAPRHCTFSPDGDFCYILTEFVAAVIVCRFDRKGGELTPVQIVSTLPVEYVGRANKGAEIQIHPSGKFLYTTNRGHNSIAAFRIEPISGKLTVIGHYSTFGKVPRHLCFEPGGRFLYVANETSHSIVSFRIDLETGVISPTGQVITTPSPTCIMLRGMVDNITQRDTSKLVAQESEYKVSGYRP